MTDTSTMPATVELQAAQPAGSISLHIHGQQDRHVSEQLRQSGVWEPFETALLQAALPVGGAFLDVGANIGYFTLLAAQCVGDAGTVVAVEPDPQNCRLLRASLELNDMQGRVELVQGALAAEDGQGELFLSEDNLGDHQIYTGGQVRQSVPIALFHGGQLLAQRLTSLDFVKIDTQGSEYQVLQGLLPLLKSLPQLPLIMVELTPYSLAEAGASGRQLIELLASLCETMWIVDHVEHRLVPCAVEELAGWCDNVAATEGDQGFMNILVGPRAPDDIAVTQQ